MDMFDYAGLLFGGSRTAPDATTVTATGAGASDGGEVGITLDADVTPAEDTGVEGDEDQTIIDLPTSPDVAEGDEVIVTLVGDGPLKTPMVTANPGSGDRQNERIHAIEADYVKATELEADVADIGFLKADSATITDLQADTAKVHGLTAAQLTAATGYVGELQAGSVSAQDIVAGKATVGQLAADHVSVSDFQAEQANIDNLQAATADIDTIRANSAKVQNLTASQLEADHATIGTLDTTYMHANMSNADVAWIQNGTIKNGAIVSAMINDVSANKLTAGTINGSVINVTNLNADNITAGTINGQRIGEGSLSLDKLSDDVYTEAEVNTIVDGLNDRIDGAIETFTGTTVPTLDNAPASSWNTTKLRDEHVGDVYYVVNSQSQQNGYCYRFTKSGSTYSWQLIKDSDVTAALSRLTTAEGKITSIESFDSTVSSFMTNTDSELTSVKSRATSLETRMTDAEEDISEKVDTSTFNSLSQTVDTNTASITSLSSTVSQKADGSTVTALTNRVSTVEQDVDGIETSIGELQTTVSEKADSSTVTTVSNKLNNVSDTVDGHTQSITSLQNTVSQKADGSTVSTLSSKVNSIEDTVDGHTSQLTSITSTQTTMRSTLDKTVKSSIQLWYSKANTTAPSKPTSQVTSTSTSGNAWRIVVPAYNASYPNYYYCWQYEYTDGTYGWSAVVRDIAMGESQATARTADSNASAAVTTANTANTNASDAKIAATTASTTASEAKTTAETAASDASTAKTNAASAVSTANSANTKANANIKSSVQLWFTKANSTAPNKPTSVVSTSNANTANAWNLVVPVWNSSYPHYFYCYQQQKGDGNYQWTDVVYDRATSEAQQLANTTSTSLTTLQEDYATYKQTTTENVSSIGTRLTTAEGKISTAESNISQNANNIALKVSETDVTGNYIVGKINLDSTTATIAAQHINLQGAVTISDLSSDAQSATLNSNVSVGGRNLLRGSYSGDGWVNYTTLEDGVFTRRTTLTSETYIISGNATSGSTQYLMLDLNTTYTLSCWAKSNGFVKSMDMYCYDQSTKNIKTRTGIALTTDWVKYEFTFTTPTKWQSGSSPTGFLCRFDNNGSTTSGTAAILYVKWPMLERGNKATDWTPAPEDVDSAISDASKTATNYVTDITGGGIMVHPSTDQTTGVRITDDVDILRDGTSVANYGTTARIGTSAGKHVSIDSDSVDLMDGTTALATFGADETHLGIAGAGTLYMADDKTKIKSESWHWDVTGADRQSTELSTTMRMPSDEDSYTDSRLHFSHSILDGIYDPAYASDTWSELSLEASARADDIYNEASLFLKATLSGNSLYAQADKVYALDPYNDSDWLQIGKPQRLTASGSYKAGTSDTMGPAVTLTAGIWLIDGIWNFANSSSNAKRLTIGLYRSSTGNAYTYRIHTTASSNTAHRLEVVDTIVVSATSEMVTLYGASSPASTSAATQYITAVRLA